MALVNWDDNYKTMYGTPNQIQGFGMSNPTFNTAKLSDSTKAWGPMDYLQKGTTFNPTIGAGGGGSGDISGLGKYMNKDFLGGAGSFLEGMGSLASGWAALKNLKLTRQAMENQQNQWTTNYEAQRLATNNAIANQNAWKQAQGRTDYGSYVGGKPAGTQYVG